MVKSSRKMRLKSNHKYLDMVDYGTIEKGDDGVREFKFTNT
jgi:hypothetical protein